MSSIEERIVERLEHWQYTWNNDVMRMIDECYAEDCEVTDMRRGRTYYGRKEMRLLEEQVLTVDASRHFKAVSWIASGNRVAVETESSWGDGQHVSRSSTFLTFNDEGLIVTEHFYGSDPVDAAKNDPRTRSLEK